MLDYAFFKKNYKLIAIDISKQALNADPKLIQESDSMGNIESAENTIMSLIIKEVRETIFDLSKRTVKVL